MVITGMLDVKIETDDFKDVYEVASEIGRGKFAVVKECRHKAKDAWFAAKVIRKRRKGVDCRAEVLQEVSMLRVTLSHPHFVDLVEVYETRHEMIIITELMRGGELFQHITTEGQLDEAYTQTIMRQVLNGLSFLHSQDIAHLDIKPQNILLTNESLDCRVKLCDLGLARNVNRSDVFEIIGTADYLAPEILDYQKLSVACDMWSTGVLAYVMLSGYSPFAGDTNQETYLNISQVNLDFPSSFFSTVSETAIQFIQQLLIKDPSCRLKVDECLRHVWLATPCPPSPNEHEPVKRLRFEATEETLVDSQASSCHQALASCLREETVLKSVVPTMVTAQICNLSEESAERVPEKEEEEEGKKKEENDEVQQVEKDIAQKLFKNNAKVKMPDEKTKEPFKFKFTFTPNTTAVCLKSLSSSVSLSPRTANCTPRFSSSLPQSSSQSFSYQTSAFSSLLTTRSSTVKHPLFTDACLHDDDTSPTLLSPFSSKSSELHSTELTPRLSRTRFWKDSSSEPSGISV